MNENYSLGYPSTDYEVLLRLMSQTSVHSNRTSSIPLADFWHPERNAQLKEYLLDVMKVSNMDFTRASKSFEYPTSAYKNGVSGTTIQYSGPSMTDLMIQSDKFKITIEAKYTEYKKDGQPYSPLIGEWKKSHKSNPNLEQIINCWKRYIGIESLTIPNDFPYQFLHRAASACFNAKDKRKILLYQLFYDKHCEDSLERFEKNLSTWSKQIELSGHGLEFIIAEIKIDEQNSAALKTPTKNNELFCEMINCSQYNFLNIVCKDGYLLTKLK